MKFGVQLYGPLNNMQGEVLEKLSALAKAGITEIEPCMTTGPILGPEGVIWPADWLLCCCPPGGQSGSGPPQRPGDG